MTAFQKARAIEIYKKCPVGTAKELQYICDNDILRRIFYHFRVNEGEDG